MATGGLEILSLHAQGGMAEVYRARASDDRGNTWYYAVKRILPELLKEPEVRRMFVEEQKIAACLVHDNIVRVYDVAQSESTKDDDAYIVMEFLDGKDLQEIIESARLARKPLPVWFAIHVVREVAKALDYASTRATDKSGRPLGLIHRDVSPHNVFVTTTGDVKLMDFGVARVATAEVRTKAGVIKGKFGYMSPEQLMSQPLDARSDLYNAGILLYEILSSKRLFYGESAAEFVHAMLQNVVPQLDAKLGVPPELDALIRRLLAKDRAQRPASARELQRELEDIVARFRLQATREHVAAELHTLFPELAPPNEETEPVPVELAQKLKPVEKKRLTFVADVKEDDVFASASEAGVDVVFSAADAGPADTVVEQRRDVISRPDLPQIDEDMSTEPMPLPPKKMRPLIADRSDEQDENARTVVSPPPGITTKKQ